MLMRRQAHRAAPRRGVILMVVLAMLTLFSIVGVTFVYFSDATAMSARINKEGETQVRPEMEAELATSLFLGQLIYDVPDDPLNLQSGLQSALRGHSFARTMYGANFSLVLDAKGNVVYDASGRPFYMGDNSLPYNGTGRLRGVHTGNPFGIDDYQLLNYTVFPTDNIIHDPERPGWRAPNAAQAAYTGGFNAPYTYCDANSMFVAFMDTATGEIKVPSFHREGIFGPLDNPSNVNWTNAQGKYMSLRPRPADHKNPITGTFDFPMPQDRGGDVKNMDGAPGGCDSIWIDINAPVMRMADGRKYKMLVAPLILDLDGRLNLNVAGNILGKNNAHASNQGWGGWEMNPQKVLNSTVTPNEWQNLFLGSVYNNTTNNFGRYGGDGFPNGLAPIGGTWLHDYAKIDFNGINDQGQPGAGNPTSNYLLANSSGTPWHSFPYFPPAGYGNAVPVETTPYHPSTYNPLRPTADDLLLSVQSMHALLRAGGTGSEFVTSDLRLLMNNLALDPTAALSRKRRNQVTTLSMDLDRPGVLPFIWNPNDADPNNRYRLQLNTSPNQPLGAAMPFQPLASRGATPAGSEYDPATWRSVIAQLGRVNLSRKLTDYPALNANGQIDLTVAATKTQYNAAVGDRQQLAADIFLVLQKVTGAVDANTARVNYTVASPEYQATRWLAQLAVNIVDFIDEDDYMTPFQWDAGNTGPGNGGSADFGFVYGVEMPRLAINEVYAQRDNDNSDPQLILPIQFATKPYVVNVFAELHNPLPAESFPGNHPHSNATAELQLTGTPVYQVVLAQTGLFTPATGTLTNPANVTGDPDFGVPPGTNILSGPGGACVVTNYGATGTVLPANGAYNDGAKKNNGFYVVGPQPPTNAAGVGYLAGADPNLPTTTLSAQMCYSSQLTDNPPKGTTVLLRRLACPHLPPQNDPTKAGYNPFITVDALEVSPGQVQDGRLFGPVGPNPLVGSPLTPPAMAARQSFGRLQPYAAFPALAAQNPATVPAGQPKNTFYRHNAVEDPPGPTPAQLAAAGQTLKTNFDWLTHLDRRLVSPLELLNVSAVKQHELTHYFMTNSTQTLSNYPSQHLATWLNGQSRLYRFFEFATTGSLQNGLNVGGRMPGKININTMGPADFEVLRAICDGQQGNTFYSGSAANTDTTVIDPMFKAMILQRTPGGVPGINDRPYLSLATGPTGPNASGDPISPPNVQRSVNETFLRPATGAPGGVNAQRMFEPTYPDLSTTNGGPYPAGSMQSAMYHPYQRFELMNKIYNNLTVRSNVFAVWMTVGFFEVVDDTQTPVILGAEIGRAENRHIRHRTFAIVDRTNLKMLSTNLKAPITLPATPYGQASNVVVDIDGMNGVLAATAGTNTSSNLQWTIGVGSVLTVDPNTSNEETVTVFSNGTNLQARFYKAHAPNLNTATVIVRGNPGPNIRYNPRSDTGVVPYVAVID